MVEKQQVLEALGTRPGPRPASRPRDARHDRGPRGRGRPSVLHLGAHHGGVPAQGSQIEADCRAAVSGLAGGARHRDPHHVAHAQACGPGRGAQGDPRRRPGASRSGAARAASESRPWPVNLAVALAAAGAKVGLLDADIYGPNLPRMLGVQQPAVAAGRQDPCRSDAWGLQFFSMGLLVSQGEAVVWRGPMLHGAIKSFLHDVDWGELDYLLVDLPPGTGDVQLSLVQQTHVAGAVIVTTPSMVAIEDAVKARLDVREAAGAAARRDREHELPSCARTCGTPPRHLRHGQAESRSSRWACRSWERSRSIRACARQATRVVRWCSRDPERESARALRAHRRRAGAARLDPDARGRNERRSPRDLRRPRRNHRARRRRWSRRCSPFLERWASAIRRRSIVGAKRRVTRSSRARPRRRSDRRRARRDRLHRLWIGGQQPGAAGRHARRAAARRRRLVVSGDRASLRCSRRRAQLEAEGFELTMAPVTSETAIGSRGAVDGTALAPTWRWSR